MVSKKTPVKEANMSSKAITVKQNLPTAQTVIGVRNEIQKILPQKTNFICRFDEPKNLWLFSTKAKNILPSGENGFITIKKQKAEELVNAVLQIANEGDDKLRVGVNEI